MTVPSIPSSIYSSQAGTPPGPNIIEITVLGPGYGEGIVLHIPGIGWGVIDSCTFQAQSGAKISLPLEYLKAMKVTDLAFAFLSHPHEDHYLGLDMVIEAFPGLRMVGRYSGDSIEELKQYWLYRDFENAGISNSMARVFRAIRRAEKNGAKYVRLSEMQSLISKTTVIGKQTITSEVKVLSPSGVSEERYANALRKCLPRVGNRLSYLKKHDHNLIASAFLIKANKTRLLLGSDVLKGTHSQTGWKGIVRNLPPCELKAEVIKVAHHGSSSAHHQAAWTIHKQAKPVAIITPYPKGRNPPPSQNDINRIRQHAAKSGFTGEATFDDPTLHYGASIVGRTGFDIKDWRVHRKPNEAGFLRLRFDANGNLIDQTACNPARWL